MEIPSFWLSAFGQIKPLAEFFGVIEKLDHKVDKLLCADLEHAKKQLSLLPRSLDRLERVKLARDAFSRAISQVDGKQKAIAYLGHAWCLYALGDKDNAKGELELLAKMSYVPRDIQFVSGMVCLLYLSLVLVLILSAFLLLILSIDGIVGWLGRAFLEAPLEFIADLYRCNPRDPFCAVTTLFTYLVPVIAFLFGMQRVYRHRREAVVRMGARVEARINSMADSAFRWMERLHGGLERRVADPNNSHRLRAFPQRQDEMWTAQLQGYARDLLKVLDEPGESQVPD